MSTEGLETRRAENGWLSKAWPLVWPPIAMAVIIGLVWETAVAAFEVPAYIFPAPSRIWEAFWGNPSALLYHAGVTLTEAVAGCIIGSFLGAILGTGFAYSSLLTRGLLPFVIAANTIPVVAIAPIIILWFGHGIESKIAVTTFLSFFPLALNMMKGLQSYDRVTMDVFHVAAATPAQRFVKMRLPSALPYIFVGIKINVSFSIIGAIVSEFVQADKGLGFVIMTTYRNLNMPRLWAALFISALLGMAFFALVTLIERLVIPWHSSVRVES
ncbi:MAG: ABC transporter permease [Hyphomicrobiaceae bacterium]